MLDILIADNRTEIRSHLSGRARLRLARVCRALREEDPPTPDRLIPVAWQAHYVECPVIWGRLLREEADMLPRLRAATPCVMWESSDRVVISWASFGLSLTAERSCTFFILGEAVRDVTRAYWTLVEITRKRLDGDPIPSKTIVRGPWFPSSGVVLPVGTAADFIAACSAYDASYLRDMPDSLCAQLAWAEREWCLDSSLF